MVETAQYYNMYAHRVLVMSIHEQLDPMVFSQLVGADPCMAHGDLWAAALLSATLDDASPRVRVFRDRMRIACGHWAAV